MLQYLEGQDLYAYLRMLRGIDRRVFFVVEGQSDKRSLERHINEQDCTLVPGYGKAAIVQAFERIAVEGPYGCIGLVDQDFSEFLNETIPTNVFTTQLYDREADFLLIGEIIDDYIAEHRVPAKVQQILNSPDISGVRELVVNLAASIGRARWASVRDKMGLRLAAFPITRVLKWPGIIDETMMLNLAIQRTTDCSVSLTDLLSAYAEPIPGIVVQICSGHDLISSLSASSKWWARRTLSRREIESFISAAVRRDILERLRWFAEIESWAVEHKHRVWDDSR